MEKPSPAKKQCKGVLRDTTVQSASLKWFAYQLTGMKKMTTKHEKLAVRLVGILQKLNLGERLDVHELAETFQVDVRTVQRDLNERLSFLLWSEQGPRFYSLDKAKLGHLYPEDIERFARFCSIQDLLPKIDQRFYQEHLTQSVQVKGIQYEDIKARQNEFDGILKAVHEAKQIEFHYTKAAEEKGKYYRVEPYALINRHGIWYLVGIDTEAGKQKTFCFSQIRSLSILARTFTPDEQLKTAIHENDSIAHGNQLSEIVVQIAPKAAPYFLRRSLLPNQELVRKLNDGGLLLACKNVNEMDVIPLVQYWLPFAQIVSPAELQQKMEQRLQVYLER